MLLKYIKKHFVHAIGIWVGIHSSKKIIHYELGVTDFALLINAV